MSRRRTGNAAFSLFAFQDIITSVTGIMILITLILAIELMNRVEGTPQAQTKIQHQNIQKVNEELQKLIAAARANLDAQTNDLKGLPAYDIATLKKMLEQSRSNRQHHARETQRQQNEFDKRQKQLTRMNADPKIKAARKKLSKLEKDNLKQQRLLKELDSSDRVLFTTGVKDKTVWVVEIVGTRIRAAKIGVRMKPLVFSDQIAFCRWARQQNRSRTGFYMLVKPEGVQNYRDIRKNLGSGFTIGFSLAASGQKLMDDRVGVGKP